MIEITLDIETIPCQIDGVKEELAAGISPPGNYKSPEAIAKWWAEEGEARKEKAWLNTSFDGALGHCAVIGYKISDGETVSIYSENYVKDEAKVLKAFFAAVNEACSGRAGSYVRVIGHNVLNFDMRFLKQRAIVLGVPLTPFIKWGAREWDERDVFDTSFQWAGRDGVRLDKLCDTLGIAGKGSEIGEDIDGSQVWPYIQRGEIAKVATYCKGDVNRAWEAYNRMVSCQPWLEVKREAA